MFLDRFRLQSLKSRLTLLMLLVVVLCVLSLAFLTKGLVREELLRYTGEQQRSALNLLATQASQGVQDRLAVLKTTASRLVPGQLLDSSAAKAFLLERPFLAGLFNSGVMIWNPQGAVLAEVQFLPDGMSGAGLTPQELTLVLQKGESVVGRIQTHPTLNAPLVSMAVPIHDPSGAVIGALAGVIRLDQPNFLSQLTSHRYGKTGNFFIIDPSQRLIFATSDTPRLMEVLPPAGVSPWIDRFVAGFEGTARVLNPHGVEVLVSIKQIPIAHWYASVTLPPEETFALIEAIKPRARLLGLVLALLSLVLIWWTVRRQLAPMNAALDTLDGFVRKNQLPQALPVVRQDEIGQLVGGFNRLLDTLLQQQKVLQDSETLKQAVLNSVTAEIAVLDHDGVILATNDAWRRYAQEDAAQPGSLRPDASWGAALGDNFLTACRDFGSDTEVGDAKSVPDGIRAVLDGHAPRFYHECLDKTLPQARWFSISVTPLQGEALHGAVVSLEDITERMRMQRQVHEMAFYDPLTQLPNRRLAMERLTQHLARARRANTRLAVLFIDLDEFKPINDEQGHEVGDWLLQSVAQRIQGCVRASDTAARMGGDEFVVLLPDLQTNDEALAVAEKIRYALAQAFVTPQGVALSISSSIGVALYPDHGDTDTDLLRMGDEAMYQAKKGGRNAVILFKPLAADDEPKLGAMAHRPARHLRWHASFASGHPEIDAEHLALFQLANVLVDQVPLRAQQPLAFNAACQQLLTHVKAHFAHEEAILLAHGYAQLADHARQHLALLGQAEALFLAAQAEGAPPAALSELIKFLLNDLVAGHMLRSDRAFFAALDNKA